MEEMKSENEVSISTLDLTKNDSTDAAMDNGIWADLSQELVELIRAFLPLSTLFRFRCVCKRWNLLHADPGFLKLYKEINPSSSPSIIVVTHDDNNRRVRAFYLESFCKWFQLTLDFLPEEACLPLAESGGLLCLGTLTGGSSLWVCNPLVRSWRRLPECHLREVCRKGNRPLVNIMVKAKTTYRVVLVGDPSFTNTSFTLVKVYHSERGLWTHHLHELSVRNNLPSTSVIRDGILYWCTMSPDGLHAYNLEQGTWSHKAVRFPRLFLLFGDAHLVRVGGQIGLIGLKLGGRSFSVGMWTLMDEEVHATPSAQWKEVPWSSPPAIQKQCQVHGFVQNNLVFLASSKSLTWSCCNLTKGSWLSGIPVPDDGDEPGVHRNWCPYKSRLDISATKGTWVSGIPVPDHGDGPQVHHNWCPYEPRLDISA